MNKIVQSVGSLPTLQQFLLKQEVKTLYRNIFRNIRRIPDKTHQLELKEWTRREFHDNAHHNDTVTIQMCIKYGKRCLKELETSINLSK